MDLGISGKTALVLGGGGGLGGAIARELAAEGAKVAVADISAEYAQKTADEINGTGGLAQAFAWDLADLSQIDPQIEAIEKALGSVDILVNNTGGPAPSPVSGQSAQLWAEQFQAMVLSVVALTDRILPGMRERGWGRIVTSTSSGVISPIPNLGLSNALRSTLLGWSKTLAAEVGRDGITSNIVLPGRVATGRIKFLDEAKAKRENRPVDEVTAQSVSSIPIGRYGEPEEYGKVVTFLASQAASYVTGSVIRIDGGYVSSI
ncbi:SDR family oxidoreductase [Rhodococcus sp. IEGM 248]|uniref:SDR family oxidoreductase n=1 Tax=Rhodococcus opacus TaxID=37919 RepID=UPI0013C02124|nr:SDR family oxidoreductase [Rhodococcus opacus]MDV7090319.1 SDR family oxidoreductase [Rhodococcus opacus]NDV06664.1 SDR family oxidoreductase [Rhodococcus sp. IEGM 248]